MKKASLPAPFLKKISLLPDKRDAEEFPFNRLPFLQEAFTLEFKASITILVGENGSGKSTLVEAIAAAAGFPPLGGNRDHRAGEDDQGSLAEMLRLAWLPKVTTGFFFRAESFFDLAKYLDVKGNINRHGGRKLHEQSHGESFLTTFQHRLGADDRAIYLLDEPEVALSPTRQLAFLCIMKQWQDSGSVQAIIATHSPILMALPGAALLSLDGGEIHPVRLEETEHYRVTRAFLGNPEKMMRELFAED